MPEAMTRPAYLSPRQVAEALSMSRRQVYRWIGEDEMPSTKIDGTRRISEKQLAVKVGEEAAGTVFDSYATPDNE